MKTNQIKIDWLSIYLVTSTLMEKFTHVKPTYFYGDKNTPVEIVTKRWELLEEVALIVGVEEVNSMLNKLRRAYKKQEAFNTKLHLHTTGEQKTKVLTFKETLAVIQETLAASRNSKRDTEIFNAWINQIVNNIR